MDICSLAQTISLENIITPKAPKSTYHVETTGGDSAQTWFELLKTQEISREMHLRLIDYCNKKNITRHNDTMSRKGKGIAYVTFCRR